MPPQVGHGPDLFPLIRMLLVPGPNTKPDGNTVPQLSQTAGATRAMTGKIRLREVPGACGGVLVRPVAVLLKRTAFRVVPLRCPVRGKCARQARLRNVLPSRCQPVGVRWK